MISYLISRIENPDWPLLGPKLWILKILGMWQPDKRSFIYIPLGLYLLTPYIELYIVRSDHTTALRNLSFTLLSSVCFVKSATFILWQNHWNDIINFLTDIEKRQRSRRVMETDTIINEYTKYSRLMDRFYGFLTIFTVCFGILAPLLIYILFGDENSFYPEIFSSWVPFDKSTSLNGACVNYIIQTLGFIWGGSVVWCYDCTTVTIMSFFVGQLKLLKFNCKQILGTPTETVTNEKAMERIRLCHRCHVDLIKYCKMLNSLVSPVLFLYVIICSLMICASAIQLTAGDTSSVERFWITEYVLALICQLFIYCWHGNEVTYMSIDVDYGVFASLWYRGDVGVRRCALLLAGQLRKPIIFTAGPFTPLNVSTFIAIMKGAYSYYTLLKQ